MHSRVLRGLFGAVAVLTVLAGCGGGGGGDTRSGTQDVAPQVPQIVTQVQSVTVQAGAGAAFTVQAQGTGPLTYQWSRNGVALADGAGVSGATSASLALAEVTPADDGAVFRVSVGNAAGQVQSTAATLQVTLPAAPQIDQQVVAASVEAGQTARFSVSASGAGTLTYRWYRDGSALADGGAFAGTQSATLTVATQDTSLDGAVFRVVVSDRWDQRTASQDAALAVRAPTPALAIDSLSGPGTVTFGAAATFSASASGGVAPLAYQWLRDGVPISGATAASYTLPRVVMADQGAIFWVQVTDARGTVTQAGAAQRVALQVQAPAAPAITQQSQSVTVSAGATATFSVAATGVELQYQWYRNGVAIADATTATYAFTAASGDHGARYHVVVTDGVGQTAASVDATITVTTRLNGTAAVGAPLAGATIVLRDAAGHTLTAQADANGQYAFDVTGLTAPFQLIATLERGENDTVHFAVVPAVDAAQGNVANITPLTTAVAALSTAQAVPRPMTAAELAAVTAQNVGAATRDVLTAIAPVAAAVSVDASTYDPLKTPFNPDRTGVDALLDQLAVTLRPDEVSIANKMAPPAPGASSTLTTASGQTGTVVLGKTALGSATAAITDTSVLSTSPFERLRTAFETCFAGADHTQRIVGGVLHPSCQALAEADYLHNGDTFAQRWTRLLALADLNGARFESPIVRLRLTETRVAVNFNFATVDGTRYTMPEIIAKRAQDGSWWLAGNGRRWAGYVETAMVIDEDLTDLPFSNMNLSKIESSIRVSFDPRFTLDNGTILKPQSGDTYDAIKAANTAAGRRTVGCAVVYGPGEMVPVTVNGVTIQKIAGFNPNGVLMRVPSGNAFGDYLAFDTATSLRLNASHITGTAPNRQINITSGGANICNGKTTSASNNYGIELTPTAGGRAREMYNSARYAEVDPTPGLAQIFDNNPAFTIVVFDTTGAEIDSMATRFLGGLAPARYGHTLLADHRLPTFTDATVQNYLRTIGSASVGGNLADMAWTAPDGAYRPDRTNTYSEIYWGHTTASPGLYTYRRFGTIGATPMISSGGVSYRRGTTAVGNLSFASQLYGTEMFAQDTGSMTGINNGYVMRQLGLRFYTEDNLRIYRQVTYRTLRN